VSRKEDIERRKVRLCTRANFSLPEEKVGLFTAQIFLPSAAFRNLPGGQEREPRMDAEGRGWESA
jgi:hypothetical protein